MTPFELSVLIHYHVSASAFKPESQTADEVTQMFMEKGLLMRNEQKYFLTTEKGVFFIEHLLRTPFPETTYFIPSSE